MCCTKLKEIAVPGDERIELKEQEKRDNYGKPRREVKEIWNSSHIVVVPVVIGALGVTLKRMKDWLKKLDEKSSIGLLKKPALLGTAKILRQVLET